MRSPTPSPTVYMQVHCGCIWNLHTSPGWVILPHERHQCLFIGCGKSFYLLDGKHLSGHPQGDQKMIIFTKMSCVCWCEPVQVPTVTTNCCPFILDSWRHALNKKNIVPSSQSHYLMLKIRIQIREGRLNAESTVESFYEEFQLRTLSDFQRMPFIMYLPVDILHYLWI